MKSTSADANSAAPSLVMLAPSLTRENHVELFVRSRYRRKREIEKLLAGVAPRCDVPSLIQPLCGHDGSGAPSTEHLERDDGIQDGLRAPTHPGDGPACAPVAPAGWLEAMTASMNAGVNDNAVESQSGSSVEATAASSDRRTPLTSGVSVESAPSGGEGVPADTPSANAPVDESLGITDQNDGSTGTHPDATSNTVVAGPGVQTAPPQGGRALVAASTRYKVQFTADQAYVDLLEQARDLLAHQFPTRPSSSAKVGHRSVARKVAAEEVLRARNAVGVGTSSPVVEAAEAEMPPPQERQEQEQEQKRREQGLDQQQERECGRPLPHGQERDQQPRQRPQKREQQLHQLLPQELATAWCVDRATQPACTGSHPAQRLGGA